MRQLRALGARALLLRTGGALLLVAGLGLIAVTEHGELLRRQALAGLGAAPADGRAAARPQGRMLRVTGPLNVVKDAYDADFNLFVATPVLTRHVEMFEWREVRLGNAIHYEMDWSEQPQDSAHFAQPKGHANPAAFPLRSERIDAPLVRVGGYALAPVLLHGLPGSEPVAPDVAHLPANLAASFSPYQGSLVTSADPARPRLGDVRVSWEAVPLQTVTIVARQRGDRLVPGDPAALNGQGYDIELGEQAAADRDVAVPFNGLYARRIGAVLLATLGSYLLLRERRRRLADAPLALATGLTVVAAVACALWLGSDEQRVLAWLALVVVGVLGIGWLHRRGAA